jgi:hypothetical protein
MPEGGGLRRRMEDNIKMCSKEVELEDADWIHLAQDRDQRRAVVNTPSDSIKCWEFL